MFRIPADHPVRRRLFPVDDDSKVDNFVNTLQESIARDIMEKKKKWNFDFTNDVALEGTYKWVPFDSKDFQRKFDWIGEKSDEHNGEEPAEQDKALSIQLENEATPRAKKRKLEQELN